MAARDIIQAAAGAAGATEANYIEDVFSTYLYTGTGTGTSQTITNGIDLSTKGGLVWFKQRNTINGGSASLDHYLLDTARGGTQVLASNNTNSSAAQSPPYVTFNNSGFTLSGTTSGSINFAGSPAATFTSWTFAKQPKFFDVVTYTGTGSARSISHSLGATPGMIITKRIDAAASWYVWHRSLTPNTDSFILLNSTSAADNTAVGYWGTHTSTTFGVGPYSNNTNGATYVAYLFADSNSGGFGPAGTDSVVACGSYTGNGSTSGPTVALGWEPQWLLVKSATAATYSNWTMFDGMRGLTASGSEDPYLYANRSDAEGTGGSYIGVSSTGFKPELTNVLNESGVTYIYLAIRRGPMKTPTDATKVFASVASNASTGTKLTTGFPVDTQISSARAYGSGSQFVDRLRSVSSNATGNGVVLYPFSTSAEQSDPTSSLYWDNTGFQIPSVWGGSSVIYWNFKRAPGFFDVVCYTGDGTSARQINHSLVVKPEMVICKSRSASAQDDSWNLCVSSAVSSGQNLRLNTDQASSAFNWLLIDFASTNSSIFKFPAGGDTLRANMSGIPYVAYLFATCPGVSKVFSFTGNGSSQTIDCGFAAGARFVLIKRTDSTGDWWVYDSARGIVSAADPALRLNSTAAEVTSADAIDPASSGFIVNQEATCNVNVNNATYIGLAIA